MRYLIWLIHFVWLLPMLAWGGELSLVIADIAAPAFGANGISLTLPMDGSARLHIAKLRVQQREFRDIGLHCARFELSSRMMVCRNGRLDAMPDAKLEFSYGFESEQLHLALVAAPNESWRLAGFMGERWHVSVEVRNARAVRLAALMPTGIPLPGQGVLNGTVSLGGSPNKVDLDLHLVDVAFGDASGQHAADKLRGDLKFAANRIGTEWKWQGKIVWQAGELFWQPVYLQAGAILSASGRFDEKLLSVEKAVIDLPRMGQMNLSATWDVMQGMLIEGALHGQRLALDNLFETGVKPFLEKGVLADSSLQGHADVDARYAHGAVQALHLKLSEAGISDAEKRFNLSGVNSDIDWRIDVPGTAKVAFLGGALLGVPVGAGLWRVDMNGLKFDVSEASLPILDGMLNLSDFHLHREASRAGKACGDCTPLWHWQFAASLLPVSMEKLSKAVGLPVMLGTLSGRIPLVSYDGNEINVGGALLFSVFDGTVVATRLKLADAFGLAPRLSGNLALRNLDLDLLTRAFSFGNMQGRMDGDVKDLQLQDWQPVSFDAHLYSSAGNYPRKISQKAVQNISSLGGAGAAAAIQRSYLSIFKNFGYDRIAWSCELKNGVCRMGGIEGNNQGGYAIIKGGGIPAISVMGYNRAVSWGELVTRLKRVTQNNVTPIIQ